MAVIIADNEHIVTAWAEECSGPGWANRPIWILIARNGGGPHRVACLQPGEQGPILPSLHRPAAAMSKALTDHVRALLAGDDGR